MLKFGPAISISLGLHLFLGGILLVSMNFHTPPQPMNVPIMAVTPIEAVVVDAKTINDQLQRIEDQKNAAREAELKRQRDEKRRKEQALQRKRDAENKRLKQIEDKKREDQRIKQRELDRRAAEERERKAREKREAEEKLRQERLKKQREDQERKEMERLMQEQLDAEQAEQTLRSQQRQKYILTEKEKYQAMIQAKIIQSWYVNDSMRGKSCRIQIKLSSTGFVISVRSLGGDKVVCVAGEQAVRRAGDLPMSKDVSVYNELKDITFNFGF
ncbi:cell envelope integrity protein TolA [Aliiglaciecola sp.]|nr:cell envelope integrity protein TolA [Aliiglaciecola sp.]